MQRITKVFGALWVAQTIAFAWSFIQTGNTFGGVRYLMHVGAGMASAAIVACAVASAWIAASLFRNAPPRQLLTASVGAVSAYVLAGVFTGEASLQWLMPHMIGAPLVWAYILALLLSLLTLPVGMFRQGKDGPTPGADRQ